MCSDVRLDELVVFPEVQAGAARSGRFEMDERVSATWRLGDVTHVESQDPTVEEKRFVDIVREQGQVMNACEGGRNMRLLSWHRRQRRFLSAR